MRSAWCLGSEGFKTLIYVDPLCKRTMLWFFGFLL